MKLRPLMVPYLLGVSILLLTPPTGLSDVHARVASWGTSIPLDTSPGEASRPDVSLTSDGTGFAIWHQVDGSNWNIWIRRHVPGLGWDVATALETTLADSFYPDVTVIPNGNATAVWQRSDSTIWARRYSPATGWVPAEQVGQFPGGSGRPGPRVAMDPSGNAIVVWLQGNATSGTPHKVAANRYVRGLGWLGETLLDSNSVGTVDGAGVALDAQGSGFAFWTRWESTWNVYARRFNISGGWETVVPIESDPGESGWPQLGLGLAGDGLLVWQYNQISGGMTKAALWTASSGWQAPVRIDTGANTNVYEPHLGVDSDGVATAVWSEANGTEWNVFSARYVPGVGWGPETPLESSSAAATGVMVAVAGSGAAFAVWLQQVGATNSVFSNRYAPGVGWEGSTLIEAESDDASEPRVSVSSNGYAAAVWEVLSGGVYSVWGNVDQQAPPPPPDLTDAFLSGSGHENMTLEWTQSLDEGQAGGTVAYQVVRSATLPGPFSQIGLVSAN